MMNLSSDYQNLEAVLGVSILSLSEISHQGLLIPEEYPRLLEGLPKLPALFDISFRVHRYQEYPSHARFQEARLEPIVLFITDHLYHQYCSYRGIFARFRSLEEWQQIFKERYDESER